MSKKNLMKELHANLGANEKNIKLSEKPVNTIGSRKNHSNIRTASMMTRYCEIQSSHFRQSK